MYIPFSRHGNIPGIYLAIFAPAYLHPISACPHTPSSRLLQGTQSSSYLSRYLQQHLLPPLQFGSGGGGGGGGGDWAGAAAVGHGQVLGIAQALPTGHRQGDHGSKGVLSPRRKEHYSLAGSSATLPDLFTVYTMKIQCMGYDGDSR